MRPAAFFTLCLTLFVSSPLLAQATGEEKLYADDIYDNADVMTPENSFRYWLETVNTTDEEFAQILRDERLLEKSESFTARELRQERERRVNASFDFDTFLLESRDENIELSQEERGRRCDEMMRLFLSEHARKKYNQRNIRDIHAPEFPDFEAGEAYIILTLEDLVTGDPVRYRVDMKLYPKGLMWRWYKSELYTGDMVEETDGGPRTPSDIQRALVENYDQEIDELNAKINQLKNDNREIALEIQRLSEMQTKLKAERAELERLRNPYGTPQSAFITAHKALRAGNWEKFLSSHSKRVRALAQDAARKRFLDTVEKDEVQGYEVKETVIKDPENPVEATLKVALDIAYRRDAEGEPIEEKRVISIKLVKEGAKWLLDEDI